MSRAAVIDEVLDFWFVRDGTGAPLFRDVWFKTDAAFDADIRARFEDHYHWAAEGHYDNLARKPLGSLALVILLDQVPRNLFRDDAQAYATDVQGSTGQSACSSSCPSCMPRIWRPRNARSCCSRPFPSTPASNRRLNTMPLFANSAASPTGTPFSAAHRPRRRRPFWRNRGGGFKRLR